jgi:hypothetical protein
MAEPLSLSYFVLRAQARKQYREALRIAMRAPREVRSDLKCAIRSETEGAGPATSAKQLRFLLSDGKQRLKQLMDVLGLAVPEEGSHGQAPR